MAPEMAKLLVQRDEINTRIKQFQKDCDHVGASKTPRGNTGNYDPSADGYWYECCCGRCGLRWTEDQ